MYQGNRYAIVRGYNITPEKVAAYLPTGYKVIWSGPWATGIWSGGSELERVVVLAGVDHNGWTLDSYVAPRLGSGCMRCDEIDLSHPIMKEIPA